MRNRSTFIVGTLAAILSFCLVDPLRIASGKFDSNSYSEIQAELELPTTTGVLVIASYDDLYKFPVYNHLRNVLGTRLAYHGEIAVEYGYDEVLTQASLGEESFLRYLKSRRISHLVIPMATAETGVVFHRWSTHGTINLDLNSKAFSLVKKSGGDFPLALYKVNFDYQLDPNSIPPSYSLAWNGVRPEFYQLLRIIDEGYNVRYLRKYEERVDTAWVFEGEQPKITLKAPESPNQKFKVELQFVAAYGDKAPPQILRITVDSKVVVLKLSAGVVAATDLVVHDGQSIKVENVFGCPQGIAFDPQGQDIREFCYGLRNVQVQVID